ncbi:hypothetical protein [Candidatus Regiella endosymbiont of Tuberolachnus salignus]|uniref:hypothetical protein n=1 Tax=Candidatus Regiella endosymbiont of Tuberolachnus salignus TaxID=3077956 RepID=UPI0030D0BDDB
MINNSLSNTLERMPVTFPTISNSTTSPATSTITPLARLAQMYDQPLLVTINTAIPAEISTEDLVEKYDIQTNEVYTQYDPKEQQIVTAWRLLTYLLGSDISFPVPTDMAELYSASATQENKLLTLYHSDLTKALIAKVLGCSPNAVNSEVAHAFFGRLAWLDTATITSDKAKAQLEKYLYGPQPFWDPAIQLGSGDYSELGQLLSSIPDELRWWMVQFKRGERLYLLTEWLPLASQKTLYDGFVKQTQQQGDDPLLVFAGVIDRELKSVKQQYRDDVLAPALNTALASKNTAVLVMLYFNWNAVQEGATREQDLPPIDWSEPISLATRRDCYQRMATYLLNSSNAPGDEDWLSDAIEQAQQANGMQVLSLATALRQARPQLERDQALKLAALLLLPLPTQTTLIKPRPENAPDPLALMDSVPEITNLLPAAGSAAPADALLDHFGLDLICQGSGADRKLSQSARDSWQLLMQTAQFEAFSAKLLQQLNWYGGHKNEQTSVRVSQALVGRAMVDHFTGSGASQAIERNFQKNWVSEYRYAELMTKLREEIKTRNPALSHASLDILSYLLFRSIAPELLLSGVPDHLSYGRGLQSVALLHGAALLEAMSPGACQGAKFDDVVNLSAQLAANTDPKIQTLWTNTRVRPALRYALAHGAISGLDDIRNATAAQITPAIHYLDAQQKLHAEALNRLNSKAPDRRALAEQQLTSAGVAREYWSSDPNPNQAELDKHHIATASEESWDRFRANIATRNNWGAGPHERGGYVPPPPVPYPPLVDLMMIGDRYVNGTDTVPTVYHRKFTAFSDTLTAAESTVIQRLLAELPAADRTLLATSTLEISRLTFGDQAAYQGIFIRCQPGDHRDDFNQHLASAQEVYFELIPAAGVARRTPQQFTYLHSRERRYIPMETMDNAVEARREHEREQIARARITPLLPFDSSAYINGTVARSAQTIPQPLNATLVPAAPLLFNTAANETATLQAIADAAAKHLLTDPIAAMKKEHNHETSWEQVFKAEKEIADFAVRTLVPFYGCIKDLAEGNDSAGVVAGCAMDTVFALIPFGQFVGSTARIVLKAGEMTVLSVAEAMGEATAKLLGGLARQSTVLAWTDMVKGARWLVKGTWQTLLEEVPSLTQLKPLMNSGLRAEGISLQGGYYHAEAAPVADGKILTGSLAHETDVLTRSTWPGKVNAVDMANNLPYGAELSTPGYAGKHIAPDFYPKKIDLQHKFYDGGFTTSITLDGSALIADRGTEIDFAVGNRVYRLTSGQTALHDLSTVRSSQADALRSAANRQSGDLSLETPLASFDDSEQLRQQAFNYRRYQPTPATTAGSASPQGGLLTLDRRIYRYDAASASPLIHEQSVLRYQNTVSARVKIDPLFGKPQAFTDEVLDTGTCVIELDGINEGVADKRTLRAIIMDNPQATGKILVLEADPLIFYGAPITDANSLQNGQVLQFTRYSDNTGGGSAVIDSYLSARQAYLPADTSLLPTRAAGILELPQTRFNRYLPFPARDMQPLELDGETFYAWKKPNIMGHYELYRINPSQPTQLTSANQFAVLKEGEWQRLGLKGGMPTAKKTIAELAAAKKQREAEQAIEEEQLEAKHQEYVKKQPQMLLYSVVMRS